MAIARQNLVEIKWKFSMLHMKACNKLRERQNQINIIDFQACLASLFPEESIPNSSNIEVILETITQEKMWNYWNYSLLEKVVREFLGDDQEMMSSIENYKKDLTAYKATTKLVDYLVLGEHQPKHYGKLTVKLDTMLTDHTLKYIENLWEEFAILYGLPPYVPLLKGVFKGSDSINWFIPRLGKRQSTSQMEELQYTSEQKQEASELQPYGSPMLDYVDSDGKVIDWSDMGIFLSVPPNATSSPVRIHVQCFLTGPGSVILLENMELVSPIYKVDISPDLNKEAKFSVAHFAALQSEADCSDMVFLHSTDRSPPYCFYPVPGGKFLCHGALGTIAINTFSKWGIGKKKRTAKANQLRYVVHLYQPLQQHRYAVFSASLNQVSYTQNTKEELAALFPGIGFWPTCRTVDLAGDVLNLIIPDQIVNKQGYSISTDQDCQISREMLDLPTHQRKRDSGIYPPRLRLTVRALDESQPPTTDLICDLEVGGTVKPCCFTLEMKYSAQDAKSEKSSGASSVHSKGKPTWQELSSHVIMEVVTTWHSLGMQLGLRPQLLDAIEQDHSKNSQRCCEEIFKHWLVHPELEPSWSSLIKALESSTVSKRVLAHELKQLFSL